MPPFSIPDYYRDCSLISRVGHITTYRGYSLEHRKVVFFRCIDYAQLRPEAVAFAISLISGIRSTASHNILAHRVMLSSEAGAILEFDLTLPTLKDVIEEHAGMQRYFAESDVAKMVRDIENALNMLLNSVIKTFNSAPAPPLPNLHKIAAQITQKYRFNLSLAVDHILVSSSAGTGVESFFILDPIFFFMCQESRENCTLISGALPRSLGLAAFSMCTLHILPPETVESNLDPTALTTALSSLAYSKELVDNIGAYLILVQPTTDTRADSSATTSESSTPSFQTKLMECVILDCIHEIDKYILKEKRHTMEDGTTALMLAASMGKLEFVECLVAHEARMQDDRGYTALMLAVENNHFSCAEALVEAEAGLKSKDGKTALDIARAMDRAECISLLEGRDCANIPWDRLLQAVRATRPDAVMDNIDALDRDIFAEALQKGNNLILSLMCHEIAVKGLDIVIPQSLYKTVTAQTPLMGHVFTNNFQELHNNLSHLGSICTKQLKLYSRGDQSKCQLKDGTALMIAASTGELESIRMLLVERGMRAANGRTALMIAARNGYTEACRILLSEAKMQDNDGRTALMLAAQYGHSHVVDLLVSHEGALTMPTGETALMFAASQGLVDIVMRLRDAEAGLQTRGGMSAMIFAAENGHVDVVSELVEREHGLQKKHGTCALVIAAQYSRAAIVNMLMSWEAEKAGFTDLMHSVITRNYSLLLKTILEARKRTASGYTALMFAAAVGNSIGVKFLIKHEAGMQTNSGWSALAFAVYHGHPDIAQLLYPQEAKLLTSKGKDVSHWATQTITTRPGMKARILSILKECEKSLSS